MRAQMMITRIDGDRDIKDFVDVVDITFFADGDVKETFRITPDFDGIRVHKSSIDDGLVIEPCCGNEIIIK